MTNPNLSKNLYYWAKGNPDNISLLETWRDSAILEIASGQGKDVANTMANGISVGFNTGGMTISDWFSTLIAAIQYLDNPPTRKVIGIFR